MKKVATRILRNLGRVLGALALCSFATLGTAHADNITKTFEFGAGLAQLRSIVRTFPVPCGTVGGVSAVVKFQRLGPDGASNNIPIIIELREPDTAADQEGSIVKTESGLAKQSEQTVTIFSPSSTRGCSLPWRVRVKYANDGTAPVKVYGTIRLDFDGRARVINAGDPTTSCFKRGETATTNLGDSSGLQQGGIVITANWEHGIIAGTACLQGPNPVKLRIQLIDPNGRVITADGYSHNEIRSESTHPKLKLTFQVPIRVSGQWKLKFINIDANNDARVIKPTVNFTPSCP